VISSGLASLVSRSLDERAALKSAIPAGMQSPAPRYLRLITPLEGVKFRETEFARSRNSYRDLYIIERSTRRVGEIRVTRMRSFVSPYGCYDRRTQFAILPGRVTIVFSILASFDATCAPYCKVTGYKVTNDQVTSSITY